MDERLQKALEFSNYSLTLNNQKKSIKQRVTQLLTVHQSGGVFVVSPDLIAFVKTMVDLEKTKIILVDQKENPIVIANPTEFFDKIILAYEMAMEEFDNEYSKLKKSRSIKTMMDW